MSRHTEPMTDAYVTGQRLRNAARVGAKIEQLGADWLLHPDNAITRDQHLELRRSRAERIDTRVLIIPNAVRDAFSRHAQQVFQSGLLLEHEGGAQ
jgi:hypothetical protein